MHIFCRDVLSSHRSERQMSSFSGLSFFSSIFNRCFFVSVLFPSSLHFYCLALLDIKRWSPLQFADFGLVIWGYYIRFLGRDCGGFYLRGRPKGKRATPSVYWRELGGNRGQETQTWLVIHNFVFWYKFRVDNSIGIEENCKHRLNSTCALFFSFCSFDVVLCFLVNSGYWKIQDFFLQWFTLKSFCSSDLALILRYAVSLTEVQRAEFMGLSRCFLHSSRFSVLEAFVIFNFYNKPRKPAKYGFAQPITKLNVHSLFISDSELTRPIFARKLWTPGNSV